MATSSDEPMKLTKDYIKLAFGHLEETQDLNKRDIFFKEYMVENVTWEITGQDHYMAGIRHSLAEHTAASFAKLRQKIKDPIKFVIRSIVLDTTIRTACVELRGYATKLNGQRYDNDYVWITKWNEQGKISSVRSYHDTNLAEKVLNED